jgi:hypothetical protein
MVALFAALIILYVDRKITRSSLMFGCILILTVDLYLMDSKLITPQPKGPPPQELQADQTIRAIKAESDTTVFRVLPLAGLDQANLMMYHQIQSVEGYSPAKLKIYQDMRDSCFARSNMRVFDMLNVKYLVGQQRAKDGTAQTVAQLNPNMLPRAWFVDTAVVSSSKAETFARLNSPSWNPRTTAIIEHPLTEKISRPDSASVVLATYRSRDIVLKTYAGTTALLVLSEIYYPSGWAATIDGRETEILKTNYVLRSVVVPAGEHTIEFTFNPPMYQLGYTLSEAGWGLAAVVLLIGLFGQPWLRRRIGLGASQKAAEAGPAPEPPPAAG